MSESLVGTPTRPWRSALFHAVPIVASVAGLLYYWFAIADRHMVFLYYHDMGAVVPDTSPFSPVTSSRYWMTGLVASGAVMVVHPAINWLLWVVSWADTPVHPGGVCGRSALLCCSSLFRPSR